eukprot:CAMPEP_0178389982 /NCGR_PEP_ID=MMETSP0689_2-20121128/10408_1 /TAXON_ID=160604 /ORGANISM="Amphidinium massartii, Strain CS-259" /LENGTH=48 /DNA_ID= /DNA_START= /DNA_END= /DNA_ORIENTATION=
MAGTAGLGSAIAHVHLHVCEERALRAHSSLRSETRLLSCLWSLLEMLA